MGQKAVVAVLALIFALGGVYLAFMDYKPGAPVQRAAAKNGAAKEVNISINSLPKVVAEINGQKINRETFLRIINGLKAQMAAQGQTLDEATYEGMKNKVLDNIVNTEVLMQEANHLNVGIDEARAEATFQDVKGRYPSEKEFQDDLKKQGFTEEEVRQEIRKSIAINKLLQEKVYSALDVDDNKALAFYRENHQRFETPERVAARHILIKLAPDASEDEVKSAEKKMDDVVAKIKSGMPFVEAAAKFSEGPSAKDGGNLGAFGRGAMVKEFEDAAFSMTPGQPGKVIRTRFGLHYVETTGKFDAGHQEFEQVKDQIKGMLSNMAARQKMDEYLNALRAKANIKTFL